MVASPETYPSLFTRRPRDMGGWAVPTFMRSCGKGARTERAPGPGEFARDGTGSKVNAPREEIPATISVVDQRTFRERGTVDLQQALSLVPGVMPLWTYGGFQYINPQVTPGPGRELLGTLRLVL